MCVYEHYIGILFLFIFLSDCNGGPGAEESEWRGNQLDWTVQETTSGTAGERERRRDRHKPTTTTTLAYIVMTLPCLKDEIPPPPPPDVYGALEYYAMYII